MINSEHNDEWGNGAVLYGSFAELTARFAANGLRHTGLPLPLDSTADTATHSISAIDVAAGTGAATLATARFLSEPQFGSAQWSLIATDISAAMLEICSASVLTAGFGTAIHCRVDDGQTLASVSDSTMDLAINQFGLMFFADKLAGAQALHRVLKKSGKGVALVITWQSIGILTLLIPILETLRSSKIPANPSLDALPSGNPLSLSSQASLTSLLHKAGFATVDVIQQTEWMQLRFADVLTMFQSNPVIRDLYILYGLDPASAESIEPLNKEIERCLNEQFPGSEQMATLRYDGLIAVARSS